MAEILGTQLVAGVVPFTTDDQYPTHYAQYGKGGRRTVATIAERDAIPDQRKEIGMTVFVKENKKTYRLTETGWTKLDDPEEVLTQAKDYTDNRIKKDYNHIVTNKVDIISAKNRLGTLSEYQLQCQLNGSTVRAFSLADISAKEFENTRQAIWNKTAEQTGMYAGIFCAGSTAGLGALKLTLHNTETNLTDIHYLCFVEDTPSQGAFLFVTTCEWNIEIRHISNKLFAYLQVPDSFAGSVIVQAVRCNIKSGGSWNAFQTDGNSYTDLCNMYNYSAQNLYTDGQKFNLELCQSLYGNVVDNSSFITPFGRYKTDIIYDFGTLEVGSKISDLVVNDSILHDLSKKVSSLSEKMTEIPESLAQYPTNEQIDEKLQNLPTNEQLTETLGGYATHEELENAKSEIDSSMQSMQGSIETMQHDIIQANSAAGDAYGAANNAQSSAYHANMRAEEAYNYATGIVVPPDNSYEVQQAQSRADEAYNEASSAKQTAEEALGATQVTDPTNSNQTSIGDALSNVYSATRVIDPTTNQSDTPINDALNNVYNSATQVTDPTNGSYPTTIGDALNNVYSATQVTDPTNSTQTTINDALNNVYNNLNDKIMQNDGGLAFALLLMSQVARDFTADLSLIGDGKCISISSSERYNDMLEINDAFFNEAYLAFKSGENIDAGDIFTNYAYENTSRKVTLKFGGETLPTFKMTNVAYPDYNLDIIIDDIHVRQMIEIQLGVSNVVALRMLEAPLTVGDNNDSCYWALVAEDGTVHNPGTY